MSKRPFSVWFWYNHVLRHWANARWRVRWLLTKSQDRPRHYVKAGAISEKAWQWANEQEDTRNRGP